MRKLIIPLMLFMVILSNCKKDNTGNNNNPNNNNNNNNTNSGIIIKGKVTGHKKNTDSLSLSDAKKVIVYSKYYCNFKDIVNDTFSIPAKARTGVALIFLDSNNHYIGNLCTRGLNILPLCLLSKGDNTLIDLSSLTMVGNSVFPSHDPFGNEIIISQDMIDNLKVIDGYFSSIAKNIDADNDGEADIISNRQIMLFTIFWMNGGYFGYNSTVSPEICDSSHYYVNYNLNADGGRGFSFSNNDVVTFTGPAADPYTDITIGGFNTFSGGEYYQFGAGIIRPDPNPAPPDAPWGAAFLPFKKGTYTLTINGQSFTLDYFNTDVNFHLILIIPILHTDANGLLTSISLEYKLPDGTIIDNPASVIPNFGVELNDSMNSLIYANNFSSNYGSISFDTPLDISKIRDMSTNYYDLLGNEYNIVWRRKGW